MSQGKIAVVTGGSAGFGAAAVRHLAQRGWRVFAGARRLERLRQITDPVGATALELDVTDPESVEAFCAAIPAAHLLVNNAGLASGMQAVAQAEDERWDVMYQTNVVGLMRVTRGLLPKLEASGDGHVMNIGSISGFEVYSGGGGYTASKHAVRAVTKTLRLELLGKPIRVTEICPGLAETEFALVRFDGDARRASAVYDGMQPLTADDVADCVVWAAERPSHVNIDEIVVRPRAQATSQLVHREPAPHPSSQASKPSESRKPKEE